MKKISGNIFVNGTFMKGDLVFDQKIQVIKDKESSFENQVSSEIYIIPGLIDIHTHGAWGEDSSDGNPEGLRQLSHYYAREGVTSWCPTTMTLPEEALLSAMDAIRLFKRPRNGAKLAGIHLEGPFISPQKKGAQNEQFIHTPDLELFNRLNEASGNQIRLITMAPEQEGAIAFIQKAGTRATISLGHTTASYTTALQAFGAGATHTTHLFNGMTSFHHRMPSVIGAAYDAGATVEIIADGIHIHPSVMRMTYRLFDGRVAMISDSLRCSGMKDGTYTLGGQTITMQNGIATLPGSQTLAGSSIHLMEGLRRTVSYGIPLEKAIISATETPARIIKMDSSIGSIEVGKCADLVILDEFLNVKEVYIDGEIVSP